MAEQADVRPVSSLAGDEAGLSREDIRGALARALAPALPGLRRVLLVPPDSTRAHSNAGLITRLLYGLLAPAAAVDILPALGTHAPVSPAEWLAMFGGIPQERMLTHNWRAGVEKIGEIPAGLMARLSEGLMQDAVPVEISSHLLRGNYDLILSIGQVVPHEVAGMANHAKNIFIGCGGAGMINASHMLGALYGMERIMGRDRTPVRALLDYAAENLIPRLPLCYILTVNDAPEGIPRTRGLFIGQERALFEQAVRLSQQVNLTLLDKPLKKVVVALDEEEFKSAWLGNKAVYRTRMAIADGGELLVLAPGVRRFGEDGLVDLLIRRHGYRGREKVLKALTTDEDLRNNLSAAAHLIHGSSEGRFSITYCAGRLSRQEVEGVGYRYLPYGEALEKYPPGSLRPGHNDLGSGESVYYIENPALGLWMEKGRLKAGEGPGPAI